MNYLVSTAGFRHGIQSTDPGRSETLTQDQLDSYISRMAGNIAPKIWPTGEHTWFLSMGGAFLAVLATPKGENQP